MPHKVPCKTPQLLVLNKTDTAAKIYVSRNNYIGFCEASQQKLYHYHTGCDYTQLYVIYNTTANNKKELHLTTSTLIIV